MTTWEAYYGFHQGTTILEEIIGFLRVIAINLACLQSIDIASSLA